MLVLLLGGLIYPPRGMAQIPPLDQFPWLTPADSTSGRTMLVGWDRYDEEQVDWVTNRLGITGYWAPGPDTRFFVRLHYLVFSSAEVSALQRWPELAGEETEVDWPGEDQITGWDRPEVGLVTGLELPLLGRSQFGLALGFPIGRDELYPFSAASIPLRLSLLKQITLSPPWSLELEGGEIFHLDSAQEYLDPSAFPGGQQVMAALCWRQAGAGSAALIVREERLDGRRRARVGLQIWIPQGENDSLGLAFQKDLGGSVDRPCTSQISVAYRVAGSPPEGP
ncbi:MAG: hypothetical protein ABIF77_07650 [bacterium]